MLVYPPPPPPHSKKIFKIIHLILIRLITIAVTLREHLGSPRFTPCLWWCSCCSSFCVVFFVLFVFVLFLVYPICCQFLLIASSVFSGLSILDCLFGFLCFSGLSILDCLFGFLCFSGLSILDCLFGFLFLWIVYS